jgi:hypothetical protein
MERAGSARLTVAKRAVLVGGLTCLLCGCGSRQATLSGATGSACTVRTGMSVSEILAACGPPDGLRYQPKLYEGWINAEVCSAPAFLYGDRVLGIGCRSTLSFIGDKDKSWPALSALTADDLIAELDKGHAAAAAVELSRLPLNDHQVRAAVTALRRLTTARDAVSRDAASRALAAIQP